MVTRKHLSVTFVRTLSVLSYLVKSVGLSVRRGLNRAFYLEFKNKGP